MGVFTIIFLLILVLVAVAIALNVNKVLAFFKQLQGFFGEVAGEMRKVTWPTTDEVINSTILVVVTTFALTIVLWLMDLIIGKFITAIY